MAGLIFTTPNKGLPFFVSEYLEPAEAKVDSDIVSSILANKIKSIFSESIFPVDESPSIVLFQSSICISCICLSVNLNGLLGFFTFNRDSKVLTAFFIEFI